MPVGHSTVALRESDNPTWKGVLNEPGGFRQDSSDFGGHDELQFDMSVYFKIREKVSTARSR